MGKPLRVVVLCLLAGAGTGWAQLKIGAVQGTGSASPLVGQSITTEGVVTGFYFLSGTTRVGFWIQSPDLDSDANPATSDGLYINDAAAATAPGLQTGDFVVVQGTVAEITGLTQLTSVTVLSREAGHPMPSSFYVEFPFPDIPAMERYESMRAIAGQSLTVTDNYQLGSHGLVYVAYGGVLREPTSVVAPGAEARAYADNNARFRMLIDDGRSGTYPRPTPFVFGPTSGEATLRVGDRVAGVVGVFSWYGSSWGMTPDAPPVFERPAAGARPSLPNVAGRLRVVGMNLYNYFNGDGAGGGFPTSRGAHSAQEFARQRAHLIAALAAMDADLLALTELENDGFGAPSAIRDLVAGLDAAAGASGTYSFIQYTGTGTDQITNALLYRTATLEPAGQAVSLVNGTFERPPLAQTFRERATDARFTVCVNHFRSKAGGGSGGNADSGDGQGGYNLRRVQQAQALAAWLATHPTGHADPDVLILGDLNSYAREDPLQALAASGYSSLLADASGAEPFSAYTYVFAGQAGALDHALATPSLRSQSRGAAVWHINAAEPRFLDYNLENKDATQRARNDGATPWRSSDHDPILVGLALDWPRYTYAEWAERTLPADGGPGRTRAPADDADGDGRANLLAYALGGATRAADAPVFEKAIYADAFLYRFTLSTQTLGLRWSVEESRDLYEWTTLPAEAISRIETGENRETWFLSTPAAPSGEGAGADRRFLRLRVTLE